MSIGTVFLILNVAAVIALSEPPWDCKRVQCPCGKSGKNVTVCLEDNSATDNLCSKWARCKTCHEGVDGCLDCPEGLVGPYCEKALSLFALQGTTYLQEYLTPTQNHPARGKRQIGSRTFMCPDPGMVPNARRLHTDLAPSYNKQWYRAGQSVAFACHSGYALLGRSILTCEASGSWSNHLPSCRSLQPTTSAVSQESCHDPGFINGGRRRDLYQRTSYDRHVILESGTFQPGEAVVFGCTSQDEDLEGSAILTCRYNGTWSHSLPQCVEKNVPARVACVHPGRVDNAEELTADGAPSKRRSIYRAGQSVGYICQPGFTLQHQNVLTCLGSSGMDKPHWTSGPPICKRIVIANLTQQGICGDPGHVTDATRWKWDGTSSMAEEQFRPLQTVVYSCNYPFGLLGMSLLTCASNSKWSPRLPSCITLPTSTPTAATSAPLGTMFYRETSKNITKQVGRTAYCQDPGVVDNGIRQPASAPSTRGFPSGSRLQYICNDFYELDGENQIFCLTTGEWTASVPTCVDTSGIPYCENPAPNPNIQIEVSPPAGRSAILTPWDPDYPEGTQLRFQCLGDLRLVGPKSATCEATGQWSEDPPTCREETGNTYTPSCFNPGTIANGMIRYSLPAGEKYSGNSSDDIPAGTWLEYTCDEGYTMEGNSSMQCEQSGMWSSSPPSCSTDCGRSSREANRKIGNANATLSGEWPWVVAIAIRDSTGYLIQCGGALINSRTVLTAAHCLKNATSYRLYFGKYHYWDTDDDSEVQIRMSQRVIIHPNFNRTTYDSDIGLVIFAPRVHFSNRIQPICLPSAHTTARNIRGRQNGYVTGWGNTENQLPANQLLVAYLPVLTSRTCEQAYRSQNVNMPITQNMFCAGSETGLQSGCRGDSGSPFVFYDRTTRRHTLEGLVSFGTNSQCGLPGRYTVFTSVFHFLPFITQNVQ